MSQKPKKKTSFFPPARIVTAALCALASLFVLFFSLNPRNIYALDSPLPDYEARKSQLLAVAALPFVDDPARALAESDLDQYSFDEINKLACPKPINNPDGWSVEMRTGGRPFLNFDTIEINGVAWPIEPCTQGDSVILPEEIIDHYAAGKGVNRMWFIHPASAGWPIVLVMTPDGFFNPAGADSPELQGAATRLGFIGEPFSEDDYLQHVDEVSISVLDDDTLLIVYSIHSEAGEGTLEFELTWDSEHERPELAFRSAHAVRAALPQPSHELGFAGFNFMKGPTLYGLGERQAFHDGRTVFLVQADGATTRELLISPVLTDTVVRENIAVDVAVPAKMVLDQLQDAYTYYSKTPDEVGYEDRADFILEVSSSSGEPMTLKRAQKAVDLTDINPEANETANVFFAATMAKGQLYEFSYNLSVTSEVFPYEYPAGRAGVVFRSDRSESWSKLYFLPLDLDLNPAGTPDPLNDGVISDPRRPSGSAHGMYVIFDADDEEVSERQRIYRLNRLDGSVRRLTIDPHGTSSDIQPSLSPDGFQFAMLTNRSGTPTKLNIESTATGLGSGFGNQIVYAYGEDWCHTRNEIAYVDAAGLYIWDVDAEDSIPVLTGLYARKPRFSPSCDQIAYVGTTGVWIVDNDGSNNTQVLTNADFPDWIDEDHLLFQRDVDSNLDIYLYVISSATTTRLTFDPGSDSEPTYIPAVPPVIEIESPDSGSISCDPVRVLGFVASEGVPVVTVNGAPAAVVGDHWTVSLPLVPGANVITAQVTDAATGLTHQAEISLEGGECVFLPAVWRAVD